MPKPVWPVRRTCSDTAQTARPERGPQPQTCRRPVTLRTYQVEEIQGLYICQGHVPKGPSTPYGRTLGHYWVQKTIKQKTLDPQGYG